MLCYSAHGQVLVRNGFLAIQQEKLARGSDLSFFGILELVHSFLIHQLLPHHFPVVSLIRLGFFWTTWTGSWIG